MGDGISQILDVELTSALKARIHKNSWFIITFFIYLFLILRFTARKDCFTHFYLSQSLGGAKREIPEKNHLQAELGMSHIRPELGSNPQW